MNVISTVKAINDSYHTHKNILRENDKGIVDYPLKQIMNANVICSHIEFVIYGMEDRYRVVLENDIINNRFAKSDKVGVALSTYYRNRLNAYNYFIKELSK